MRTKQTTQANEVCYYTRHLSRALHSRLHIVKAARNAKGSVKWTVDAVLNEALGEGLTVLEKRLGSR